MEYVRVTSVQVLGHYQLRLGFSDGSSRDVGLNGALHGPVFEPLTDPNYFTQVRVDNELGTVVWPNGADLDPLVLHGDFEPVSPLAHR
jgi:Protein of unknown function (DUF2442)